MLTRVYSAALQGVEATRVEVEVNTGSATNSGSGNAMVIVVGLPDAAVRESKDRVTTAISNSGLKWPRERTTINLAPADIKKEGPCFDLPIAIGMVAAAERNGMPRLERCLVAGELALTGAVRPVKGALPMAVEARKLGLKALILPSVNAAEAAIVEGIDVYGVESLRQAYEFLARRIELAPVRADARGLLGRGGEGGVDFSEVRGQHQVKRAIEVAVAGGHNVLLIGPPGSGKSMLAKRIPGILPPMTLEEAIETTKIHSVCGLLGGQHSFVAERPFRSPHHTISDVGLLGGSTNPTPGEVSLAHNGVLFLDELPEFKRSTLEVMRQPLEDRRVTISRAAGTMTFPAGFVLVAAMNPCPCGYFTDPRRECRCSPAQIERYRARISGPLLDRIDIHVEAPAVAFDELTGGGAAEASAAIRERVVAARGVQAARHGGSASAARGNAFMGHAAIKRHCELDAVSLGMLRHAMEDLQLSARAYDRILKVSRTIADLDGGGKITSEHIGEAIQYRTLDRRLWV